MTWSLGLWHIPPKLVYLSCYTIKIYKKCNVLLPIHPPSPCISFSPLHNVQPDSLWRLVNRNGSSTKLCTMGISTFLFSHKITACCSILCYGRCVPMGWLVEQRMGESGPACSSKQVLHAFEDAHFLQAKVGLEEEMCMLSDVHMHTRTYIPTLTAEW